jgi:ubiquinol-cytochrome c reductase cytochrome c subunit
VERIRRSGAPADGDHRTEQDRGGNGDEQRQDQPVEPPPAPDHAHRQQERHDRHRDREDGGGHGEPRMELGEGGHRRHGTRGGDGRVSRRAGSAGRARSLAGLGALGVAVVAAVAAWALSPGPPDARAAAGTGLATADGAVVEAGRALFTANCAACHGPAGQGGSGGPSLVGVGAASADFYLRTGRMPLSAPDQQARRQPPRFGEEETQALVAYVASLGPGPAIPQVAGGGDLQRGWDLFQANCAACHNATGAGNAIGGGYVATDLGEADPTTVGEATIIGPGAMPAFAFDDASLADIAEYVRWLRDAPTPGGAPIGEVGPVAEGFVAVAVGLPLLVLVALFAARRTRARPSEDPAGGTDR